MTLQRLFVAPRFGSEAAFVADAGSQAAILQDLLERVVDLGAHAQTLGERGRAYRHDHELLQVDVVVRVHAAVEDVHHRHRQRCARSLRRCSEYSVSSVDSAAALAAASDTPRIAFAPSLDLFGVPSSAISAESSER